MPSRHDELPVGPGSTIEFMLLYGVLAAMALAVACFVASVVIGWIDARARLLAPRPRRKTSRSDDLDHRRYAIGFLPIEEEILGVAWLRGGAPRVAETLRAWGEAEGWLVRAEARRWVLKRLPLGAPPWASRFTRPLATGTITDDALDRAAASTAAELVPTIELDLLSAGFVRSAAARTAGAVAIVVVSLWVVILGAIRVGMAPSLGEPTWILAGEVATVMLAAFALGALIPRRTDAADRWLAWLDKSTAALRRDHARGRARRAEDAALVVAAS